MVTTNTNLDIRVWPGVVIVVLQWLAVFGSGIVAPASPIQVFGMMGGPSIGALLLFVWWLFASRAPWPDRLGAVGLMIVAFVGAMYLVHESMRMATVVYGIPFLCLAFVGWAIVARRWPEGRRRLAMVATILVASGVWTLLRSDGVQGDLSVEFAWRWGATAETRFLASKASSRPLEPVAPTAVDTGVVEAQWPGFRGAARDGVVTDVRLATDWTSSPPEEIWRRPIGPGWSSFAVAGDRLYTQEQRGEDEVVACYNATNGEPVWLHTDRARFWEAMAGPGPRATPTFHAGRVYVFGATGILNALDAVDGSLLWTRDAAADTGASTPDWGFASSPLVVDGLVVVLTGGPDGKAVVAYDIDTGEPRWFAPAGALSYSSAHLATIDGTRQIIVLTGDGATSLAPADGTVLWEHAWPMGGGARIVQPAITADGSVLIGTGFGIGLRRITVSLDSGGWTTEERWTSTRLKPYYNDLVVHRDHVYGFDGRILACLDLASGERKWKGGRYGNGQLILLPDQDLLLVLSDRGEVALVEADPAGFSELARVPAIVGKTWNHPVRVDDVLYVRNGEEMAALRLPVAQ